jgi:hypothetical protein
MTGPLARWLRRPVFWTTGVTLGGVLFLAVFAGAATFAILVFVTAAVSRAP